MVFRLLRPDSKSVWNLQEIAHRFSRYKAIIDRHKTARFIIARTIPADFNDSFSNQQLEELLRSTSIQFNQILASNQEAICSRKTEKPNYIDLVEALAFRYLQKCIFCERKCGVNRIKEEKGFCFLTSSSYVSSAFLHMGEESVLVPSGTIFFQGCNFACVFCQNYDISQAWKGKRKISDIARKVNKKQLAEIADKLSEKGALNINYVGGDPIPNLHTILGSLNFQTSNICQLWNSNFYLTSESLLLLIDLMDFWLPDFKYGNNECAERYSGVKDYYTVLTRNLKEIHDLGSGEIIVRHLVMPNHVECCSIPILDYIHQEVPNCVVNIMAQYRPMYHCSRYPEINRTPSMEEMHIVKNYADELGILWKPVS
jgi:putative pyruvate formate lyase activating enzyme